MREFIAELADCFQEGQALDIADRAADFHQHEVEFGGAAQHDILDGVGDVGNDLDGGAEIVATAFLGDHLGIDFARRRIIELARGNAGEALVMAEIKVGLRAVIGHEDFAVLVRAHRARIDIEIGIKLAQPHGIPAGLQQCTEGRRGDTLTEGRNHAAGDKYKPRHGIRSYMSRGKSERGKIRAAQEAAVQKGYCPLLFPGDGTAGAAGAAGAGRASAGVWGREGGAPGTGGAGMFCAGVFRIAASVLALLLL